MLSELKIYHKPGGNHQSIQLSTDYWHFGTCMRSIVFSSSSAPTNYQLSDYQCLRGEAAYQFLLEVICGLHSKLMGETEILGQFKEFSRQNKKSLPRNLNEVITSLLRDAKFVRTNYLQNLGCQSYGSLLRKSLNDTDEKVVFIGAGLLVKDILPWLVKKNLELQVYTRDPKRHKDILQLASSAKVHSYDELHSEKGGVLVIAAPVDREWLEAQLDLSQFSMIYDLRGQSDSDSFTRKNYLCLNDFIGDIEKNQIEARRIKVDAQEAIEVKTLEKNLIEKPRPFGWEDLWAYS